MANKRRQDTYKDGCYWVRCKDLCEGELMLLEKFGGNWFSFGCLDKVPYCEIKEIVSRTFPNRTREIIKKDYIQ